MLGWHSVAQEAHLAELVDRAQRARQSQARLPADLVGPLQWRPQLIASMTAEGRMAAHHLVQILEHFPEAAVRALMWRYNDLAPLCQAALIRTPENAERILNFVRTRHLTLFGDETDLWSILAGDPNREFRLVPLDKRPTLDRVVAVSYERRYESPAWAYCYLSNTQGPVIDDELLRVLAREQEYALLGVDTLTDMGYPYHHLRLLVRAIIEPRWVYQLLVRQLVPRPHEDWEMVRDRILTSPAWAVEAFGALNWRLTEVLKVLDRAWILADKHPLMPIFADYVRLARHTCVPFAPRRS